MDPMDPSENGRTSIAERAAAGEGEESPEAVQQEIPLAGDKPLTLAGLGPRGMAVETKVSLMSAGVAATGLIDPDKPGQVIVSYLPRKYEYVPVRDGDDDVERWKLNQVLRPYRVAPANDGEAIESVVMNAHGAGMGLDEIRDLVHETLAALADTPDA